METSAPSQRPELVTVILALSSWLFLLSSFLYSHFINRHGIWNPGPDEFFNVANSLFMLAILCSVSSSVSLVAAARRSKMAAATAIAGIAGGGIVIASALIVTLKFFTYGTL